MIDAAQFQSLAEAGHTRIPVVREVLSDVDTPLSVYLKLADGPHTYLFESVEGGERFGRYSIIGLPARRVYSVRGQVLETLEYGQIIESRAVPDPLRAIENLRSTYSVPKLDGLPGFTGGLVGWFGFECVEFMEPRLGQSDKPDELGTPDILLMVSEELAVFDSLKGRLYLIVHADPAQPQAWLRANRRLDALEHRLRHSGAPYPETLQGNVLDETDFVSGFTREGFLKAVRECKDYISAGDTFQVVLSQRLSIPFNARPVDVYRALRAMNPSPYMYFLDTGILVRLQGDKVTMRPIAGTRPRGATPEQDRALEAELLADPKERAEHLMLIDLGRNDTGRVSKPGTVEVGERFMVERYSHVMHIVSEVTGQLRDGLSYMDVLLEIIRDMEPVKRNIYSGAVGYIGWHGDADTAIAIRTAVIQDGRLHVQAGAGIVFDSDPEKEWEETMSKGRALFRAVAEAARGL